MANLKRPGGELASRPLHFIWVVDCSGSMYGEKIGAVNHAIQSTIPEMVDAANDNPNAEFHYNVLEDDWFEETVIWLLTEVFELTPKQLAMIELTEKQRQAIIQQM